MTGRHDETDVRALRRPEDPGLEPGTPAGMRGTSRCSGPTRNFSCAWAGQQDDAVELLTRLATVVPGLPPADIARQPLYTTPLRGNARFEELARRLEADLRANAAALASQ